MKVQRGGGKKSSGRYHMQYEEEYYYEDDVEGEDEFDTRHRWPARSADGKFRVRSCHMSVLGGEGGAGVNRGGLLQSLKDSCNLPACCYTYADINIVVFDQLHLDLADERCPDSSLIAFLNMLLLTLFVYLPLQFELAAEAICITVMYNIVGVCGLHSLIL